MSIHALLLLTCVAGILITTGLMGLYANVCYRLRQIEKDIKSQGKKINTNKRDIRVIKEREAQKSDRVIITHAWDEAEGIRYPSQEV